MHVPVADTDHDSAESEHHRHCEREEERYLSEFAASAMRPPHRHHGHTEGVKLPDV